MHVVGSKPVLVAGGGIGGLSAALALARQGLPVKVLEQAASIGEIGAGIQLGPNAFAAFDALGLGEKARARAVYTDEMVMHDALDESLVGRIPVGDAFRARFGNPYGVIHRADVHRSLLEAAEDLFGTRHLAIGGASAGANLAMVTLLRLRERGLANPFLATVLLYGAFDLSGRTPAGRALDGEFFIDAYLGGIQDRTIADISPIFGDLHDLPPALLVVGTEDLLFEDSLAMAARLAAAGGEVDLRVFPESPHGFASFPIAMGRAAMDGVAAWLGERLAGP